MSHDSLSSAKRRVTAVALALSLVSFNFAPLAALADASSTDTTASSTKPAGASPDTTVPVITLTGEASVTLTAGDAWTDPGATANDDTDGDISKDVIAISDVDTSTAGTYTVKYDVSDAAGNKAAEVTRDVTVNAASSDDTGTTTPPTGTDTDGTATTTDSNQEEGTTTPPLFRFFAAPHIDAVVAPTTVVVQPSAMNDWYFYNDQNDTTLTEDADHGFVTGPDTAPEGEGSVHLTKTTTDDYGIATNQFAGTALSAVTSLSFSTYRATGSVDQVPSLGFDVDSDTTDGLTGYEGRLTYEPYFSHAVNAGSWQTWDTQDNAGNGNWWFSHASLNGGASVCTQNNPCTWSELLSHYPHAAVSGRFILRTNGSDTASGDLSFDGNVDNLRLATASADTTYDFDPDAAAPATTLAITAPAAEGDTASGTYDFTADYENGIATSLQWAIRTDASCNTGTVAGNVDGHSDASTLSGTAFSADLDTAAWTNGTYCFVVNDGHGNRVERHFAVDNIPADTEAPTVAITPSAGALLHGTETFTITVSDNEALDPSKNTHIWVYLYNKDGSKSKGANVDLSSGTGTFTVDTTLLNDGYAWLDVGRVQDAVGNWSGTGDTYFKDYVIDNTGPTVSVTPAAGSTLSGTVTFTITVTDPHLDPSTLGHIWTYLYNNLPPQATKGGNADLSSGTGTLTVDTTQLANGTSTLDVGKLYDALGNPSGAGDSYFRNYAIRNYTYSSADSKFTADPEYIRANNGGDTAAIALVPADATAARFTYTQTDGSNVYTEVAGTEHVQAGQFPVPSTGAHQYRGTVSAAEGAYTVTGEYEAGGTWYPITGDATLYALGTPTGDFILPSASSNIFRPGDNPLRIEANDANDTFRDAVFNVDGTNYEVDRAACDLREAGNRVICDVSSASNWTGLPNGTYTGTATLYNLASNHAAITSPSFTVSDSVPVVTNFAVAPSSTIYGTSFDASADATDSNGIKDVDFYITAPRAGDGVCDGNGAKLADSDQTSGTGSAYSTTFDTTGLSGDYCVNVVAGNVAATHSHPQSIPVTIVPDTTRPALAFNLPAAASSTATSSLPVSVTATDSGSGLASLIVHVYNGAGTFLGSCGAGDSALNGAASDTYTCALDTSGYADGSYSLRAGSFDMAGHNQTVSLPFIVDNTRPAPVTITAPANGAILASGDIDVTGTAADATSGIDRVLVYVSKVAAGGGFGGYAVNGANAIWDAGTGTWSYDVSGLADGTYTIKADAFDAAGNNHFASPSPTVTIDKTAPAKPAITAPADGSTLTTATWTGVTWTDVSDSGTPITYIYQSATDPSTNPDGSFASPAYTSASLTTTDQATTGTPEGAYYVHVKATDAAGNSVWSDPITVTVDNASGSGHPTDTAPVADDQSASVDENGSIPVTLTATDADGDTLSFATTSNPVNGTLTGIGAGLTYTPDADFSGTDSFTFTANDGTDVSNTATVSITVNAVTVPTNNRSSNFKGSSIPNFNSGTSGQVLGASTFNFRIDFGQGSTLDPDVTELQKILMADGYLVIPAPTGYFGPLTTAAVKQYQAAHSIQTTGFVGPLTRAALNAGTIPGSDAPSTEDAIADLLKQVQDLQNALDKLNGSGN